MSNLSMNQAEEQAIDSKVEQMMDWAQSRKIEAEQLALDSARLMACTTDRLDRLSKQGFYKRCWSRFNGDAGAMERANVNDVIQMQKMAFRYVNMLQEQQLLMAHSLLSLKNNLNSLAVKEEETRNLITMLAQRTLERFEQLEGRVGKLETSSNLHDWLFTLEERDYEEKIPTDYMRLLRVINDFYDIKNDNWNNNDLMFMRKAIRTVGLNPKQKLSINAFIDKLADEIQSNEVGFDAYDKAITLFAPDGMENYSQFAIENVSSPVFATLHGLNTQYRDKMDAVEALQDSLSISTSDALKTLLRQSIKGMNVNLDYEFPLAETAIEILGCMRLGEKLSQPGEEAQTAAQPEEIREVAQKDDKEFAADILKALLNTPEEDLFFNSGVIMDKKVCTRDKILNHYNLQYLYLFYMSSRIKIEDYFSCFFSNGKLFLFKTELEDKKYHYFFYDDESTRVINAGEDLESFFGDMFSEDFYDELYNCTEKCIAKLNRKYFKMGKSEDKAALIKKVLLRLASADSQKLLENSCLFNGSETIGKMPGFMKKVPGFTLEDTKGMIVSDGTVCLYSKINKDDFDYMVYADAENHEYAKVDGSDVESLDKALSGPDEAKLNNAFDKLSSFWEQFEEKYNVSSEEFINGKEAEEKAPASSTPNARIILSHFSHLYPGNNLYIKGKDNPSKVYNKLQKGLSSFGMYTDEEEVLIYFDSTLFGGGDEGFILTADTIYFKNSGHDEFYSYDIIERVTSNFTGFKIDVGYETLSISCTDSKVRDAAVSALRAVKNN